MKKKVSIHCLGLLEIYDYQEDIKRKNAQRKTIFYDNLQSSIRWHNYYISTFWEKKTFFWTLYLLIAFICLFFDFKLVPYTSNCSATSGPGWRAKIFFNSTYNLSLSCIIKSFSTTASVLDINTFCNSCIRTICAWRSGSESCSFLQRCT